MAEPEPLGEDDISPEAIERRRREDKRERVANACQSSDVADLFSLWQETTDLLFRTNLVEGSRVEELWDLRRITFALTAVAHNRHKERLSLQKLSALLRTLMPREWFPDASTRSKVLEVIMAANVDVEELYLASLKGDPAPLATPPAAEGPTSHPKEVDYADAMARYSHSRDDMQTVMLNPIKVIPFDNYPEETQIGHGVITRGKNVKKYVSYVLRIAAENERLVEQARSWWAWWEKAQVDPNTAGPVPLVSDRIEAVLRMAAGRRSARSQLVARAVGNPASGAVSERPIPDAANDLAARNILAHFLANGNTSTTTVDLYDVTGVSERKTEELLRLMHSRCGRCPSDDVACPDHLGLLKHEPGKTRGWYMATDRGLEVARRQSPPPNGADGSRKTKR